VLTSYTALLLLCLTIFHRFWRTYRNPPELLHFPFLSSLATGIFALPTLLATVDNTNILSRQEYTLFTSFWFLTLFFSHQVYYYVYPKIEWPKNDILVPRNNAWQTLTLLGFLAISTLAWTQIDPRQYGNVTGGSFAIVLYFTRFLRPISLLSILLFLCTKKRSYLLIYVATVFLNLPFAFVSGRRSDLFFLPVSLILPLLWASSRRRVEKYIKPSIILILPLSYLVFYSIPEIRIHSKAGDYAQILEVNLLEEIKRKITAEDTNEVVQAAIDMNQAYSQSKYNYGSTFWNRLVNQFVSSTIFGQNVKESVNLHEVDFAHVRRTNYQNYWQPWRGYLAPLGPSETFLSFSWFGLFLFSAFSYACAKISKAASTSSDIFYRYLAICLGVIIPFSFYDSLSALTPLFLPYIFIGLICFKFRFR
jgi:hypothetical protein